MRGEKPMSYGVRQNGKFIFCANCGKVVSENGQYSANFCYNCGNPLKMSAIEQRENEIAEAVKNAEN